MLSDIKIPIHLSLEQIRDMVIESFKVERVNGSKEIRSDIDEVEIWSVLDKLVTGFCEDASPEAVAATHVELVELLQAGVETGRQTVVTSEYEPWLHAKRSSIDWKRWKAFRSLLSDQGRTASVLDSLHDATDEILDLVGDPKSNGAWARRGLVIGEVQSGKTQTYLALMNKAADAGYRVIVVVAGNTEYLRQQTQQRVDEGFIGKDSTKVSKGAKSLNTKLIGVGKIDSSLQSLGFTTQTMDYLQLKNDGMNIPAVSEHSFPYVFVVKKNTYVLEALDTWAKEQIGADGKIGVPILFIDDESDYASVNTGDADDPTQINAAIRRLLSRFERSSYLAITATPFANIFINHTDYGNVASKNKNEESSDEKLETSDLFPKDYVMALKTASSYVGIKQTFGTIDKASNACLLDNSDAGVYFPLGHKKDLQINALPASLIRAMDAYLIANAIRDIRGQTKARRSMLVNVSKFTDVQNSVAALIDTELAATRREIELFAGLSSTNPKGRIARLKECFESVYSGSDIPWAKIASELPSSSELIRVKVYNSNPNNLGIDQEFDSRVPDRQIALGGDLLSRGLTLDNLMISYFFRRPRAADTLMQMARWFGYRNGYLDMCRIWIEPEVRQNYRCVGDAVDELKSELRLMRDQERTPLEFGLAVQEHPESLIITSRSKSKHVKKAEKVIDLTGRRVETTRLPADVSLLEDNFSVFEEFLDRLLRDHDMTVSNKRHPKFHQVPRDMVATFVGKYETSPEERILDSGALQRMIKESTSDAYKTWDVVLINGATTGTHYRNIKSVDFRFPERRIEMRDVSGHNEEAFLAVSGSKARLAGSGDLRHLLTPESLQALADGVPGKKLTEISEDHYYQYLNRPAILLYPLAPKITVSNSTSEGDAVEVEESDNPRSFVAVKIALPKAKHGGKIKGDGKALYWLNTVAAEEHTTQYWENI